MIWQVLLLEILFSSTFPLAKCALPLSSLSFFVACRMLLSGFLFLLYLFWTSPQKLLFSQRDWVLLFLIAFLGLYLTNIWEYAGLRALSVGKTCFLYSFTPFISALVSRWFLGEKLSTKKLTSMLFAFVGLLILLVEQRGEAFTLTLSLEEGAVLGAAITTIWGWVFMRKLLCEQHHSILAVNGWSMLVGGACALLHSCIFDKWEPLPLLEGKYTAYFFWLSLTTLVSNFICYNLYAHLLKRLSVTFLSLAGGITPLFTALFGWIFLGEVVSWNFWVAFAVVFPSLYFFYREELNV